jgi:hypothetical protein
VALGIVVLALAVLVGMALERRWATGAAPGGRAKPAAELPPMPEVTPIAASWRAAEKGNVEGYLACFAGSGRSELDARLARQGREAFQAELRAAAEAALGVEWGPPKRLDDGALSFPVTVLHKEDAEQFDYVVAPVREEWKIRAIVPRGRGAKAPPYSERLGPPAGQGDQR